MARPRLNRGRVIAEAAVLVDEQGYDQLQMSALAARLGVSAPGLYKHIQNQDALRAALAAHAVSELGDALATATAGLAGRAALVSLATTYRDFARRHPGRYAATVRAPEPNDTEHLQNTEKVLGIVLAVLAGYGLEGESAIDATRMLRSSLHGFASLEAAGGFGLPSDVDRSFARLLEGMHAALSHMGEASPA